MLAEWLRHLTTPCPPKLKRMGYLKELISIDARHKRCFEPWAPHLKHCKQVIRRPPKTSLAAGLRCWAQGC